MSEPTIPWYAVFGLMTVGRGTLPTLHGVVRVVSYFPEDDDEPVETLTRVWVDGSRVRRETLDGQLESIDGEDDQWVWDDPDLPPVCDPHSSDAFVEDGGLLGRRDLEIWDDEEDERPVEPIRSTAFLGRPAWDVRWTAPGKRRMVIDDETGLVLHESGSAKFIRVAEWLELTVGDDLDDALFMWDGPARDGDDGDDGDHDGDDRSEGDDGEWEESARRRVADRRRFDGDAWHEGDPWGPASARQPLVELIGVLEAIDRALSCWDEVTALRAASDDEPAFLAGLRQRLGVDGPGARVVADFQPRRPPSEERVRIADEVARVRRDLAALDE